MDPVQPRRVGAYLHADESGHLPSRGPGNSIKEPWASPVQLLADAYVSEWGATLHSLYIRGSVARNLAIPGVSDIDSFGVLNPGVAVPDPRRLSAWSESVTREVEERFPFVAGVEVDLVPFEAALDRTNFYAFILMTEAVCVHGDCLADRLEPFKLSEANFQTRYFRQHLDVFISEYPAEPVQDQPGFVAWLAKRFLRLGMELVMEKENRYTRDLYLCYESFADHYPAQAQRMRRALELAVNPVANEEVEAFLLESGEWLAAEADGKLALTQLAARAPMLRHELRDE